MTIARHARLPPRKQPPNAHRHRPPTAHRADTRVMRGGRGIATFIEPSSEIEQKYKIIILNIDFVVAKRLADESEASAPDCSHLRLPKPSRPRCGQNSVRHLIAMTTQQCRQLWQTTLCEGQQRLRPNGVMHMQLRQCLQVVCATNDLLSACSCAACLRARSTLRQRQSPAHLSEVVQVICGPLCRSIC